nr:pyridoxamine 5'-phosphate oxidase family protein [uncultured Cetobacterium sp.]
MMNKMMNKTFNPDEILKETTAFINEFKSVVLGTVSKDGEIDVTYAPHILANNEHYIFISEIGDHFRNLKENCQKFEIMFLQDECKSTSVVVRKRARFNVTAQFLPRDEKFEEILDIFEKNIGDGIKVIRKMQDFHLVKLNVLDGRFVKGFGQAYIIKGNSVSQMTGDVKTHKQ